MGVSKFVHLRYVAEEHVIQYSLNGTIEWYMYTLRTIKCTLMTFDLTHNIICRWHDLIKTEMAASSLPASNSALLNEGESAHLCENADSVNT